MLSGREHLAKSYKKSGENLAYVLGLVQCAHFETSYFFRAVPELKVGSQFS
jgi:hypothetical protein